MNPFDLRGPEFLVFYLILSAVVIGALMLFRRMVESGEGKMDLADPYLIASLRGGENEVFRVALISLIDRGLLIVDGTQVRAADRASADSVRRVIEKEIIRKCAKPRDASSLFYDPKINEACREYQETLKRCRLLPDEWLVRWRWIRFGLAAAVLIGAGGTKVIVALERGRTNVGFLIVLMIAATVIAAKVSFPRLTDAGKAILADIQTLYSGLKGRATLISPGGASIDAMMLAAAFGIGMLPVETYGYTRKLFPVAQSSGSNWSDVSGFTSSCSSSGSSGGSSCGGGGCGGGCGGCGS